MRKVTVGYLRERVRELADMKTASPAAAQVKTAQLDRAIYAALCKLRDKLIAARGDDYFAKTIALVIVAGQATYDESHGWPSDFLSLISLQGYASGSYWEMEPWQRTQTAALLNIESSGGGERPMYKLTPTGIELRPAPSSSVTLLRVTYLPTVPIWTEGASDDELPGYNGWDEWIALTAAIELLNGEESYEQANARMGERLQLDQKIDELASSRDANHPKLIQDVRRDWHYGDCWPYYDWE